MLTCETDIISLLLNHLRLLPQIHRTLLHHHAAVLLLPGLLRRRPLLPGPHRHGCGEAAHSGRPGNLVVRGPDLAHYRRSDAQRLQQLVHLLLRRAASACRWERSVRALSEASGGSSD